MAKESAENTLGPSTWILDNNNDHDHDPELNLDLNQEEDVTEDQQDHDDHKTKKKKLIFVAFLLRITATTRWNQNVNPFFQVIFNQAYG